MPELELTLLGGLVFGLASSLHCGAMCGGVCAAALTMMQPGDARERLLRTGVLNAGRITTYATLGAIGALFGASLLPVNGPGSFRLLQWAAAVSLIWMGLSMAGMMPRFALADRGTAFLSRRLSGATHRLARGSYAATFGVGVTWGLSACPMVYGAVFTAALTGSPQGGALFMTGFGLGTLPAVASAGLALMHLKSRSLSPTAQTVSGLAIAAAAFASLYAPWGQIAALCLAQQ